MTSFENLQAGHISCSLRATGAAVRLCFCLSSSLSLASFWLLGALGNLLIQASSGLVAAAMQRCRERGNGRC